MKEFKLTEDELHVIRQRAEDCGSKEVIYKSLQGTGQLMTLLHDLKEVKEGVLWDYPQVDLFDVMYETFPDDYSSEIVITFEAPDKGEALFKEFCEDAVEAKKNRYDEYLKLKEEFENI